ncbi:MAG: TIGR04438 family Trp-rich protein [Aquabacterium sp.]|jgi:small Trp-rich protein|uniref:TIGR04438 family Trp-rich protein n=1 Tax=Aquabacterium sp. TaxID=1872578 RepID=UPI003BB0E539
MWFVVIGVALMVMNIAGIGPVAEWTWKWDGDLWKFLLPFGLAILWWFWADTSGWTQRKAMEKVDAKRDARRDKALDALGMGPKKSKR